MADPKKAGMISGMSPLAIITGDELMEVSSRQRDGTWKTFSILINKIRTNQGLSAYEVAVKNGYQGTEEEWLLTLNGKSAYELAVELGFTGTEEEWLKTLVGPSAYASAVADGYNGTEAEWLKTLVGKSAYEIAQANGFTGTQPEWLESLKGKSAYAIAKEIDPTIGTEAEWLKTLVGASAYDVAVEQGFDGTEAAWLDSLKGKSAYQIWVALGNTGTEADFVAALKGDKGDDGQDGKSAFQVWQALPGNADKTEDDYFQFLQADLTREKLQELLDLGRYVTKDAFTVEGANSGVIANAGFFNFLFLFDKRLANENNSSPDKVPQRLVEMSRMEAEGYSYWKNDSAPTNDPAGKLPAVPDSEVRLYDDGRFEIGSLTDFISFGNGSKVTVTNAEGSTEYDLAEATQGGDGKSAYQIAVENGFVGTEAEWLLSLQGKSAYQVWEALPGNEGKTEQQYIAAIRGANGTNGTDGADGEKGASAYEVAVEAGFVGTEAEWLASLKGKDGTNGENGTDGTNGLSAYEIWVAVPANAGKTEEEFLESLEGKSAYAVWETLPGNGGKSEAEFIASLKGAEGKSAYQTWRDEGNTGTEAQFLLSLKGEKGENGENGKDGTNGTNGTDGKDGTGVNILETITQEDFDQIVADNASNVGDGYIVGEYFQIFNGTDWVQSNNLRGPDGKGLNYLGTWPTGNPLPLTSGYKAGDTYIWGATADKISLWTLAEAPTRQWYDIGVPGPKGADGKDGTNGTNGKDAYQAYLEIPGNEGKTREEFIASLKGDKGEQGDSAYQLAVEAGFVGTEAEWLVSLKGEQGDSAYQVWLDAGNTGDQAAFFASLKGAKGDAAAAFEIIDQLSNVSELPRPGKPEEAYYVGKDLYVWFTLKDDYENLGSLDGASAYQIWLSNGNTGTEAQFLASLKGTNGTNGTDGKSAYEVAVENGYVGTEPAWLATLVGKSAYEEAVEAGFVGSEAQWIESLKGKDLQVKGTLANEAAIKALANPAEQDAYIAADTDHLWIYSSAAWFDAGKFGGEDGKSAYEIWLEVPANAGKSEAEFLESLKGEDGTNGTNGTNGTDGKDLDLRGTKADAAEIQAIVDPVKQEAWVANDTGHLFIFNGLAWVDVGEFRGADGKDGTNGTNGTNGQSAFQIWQALPDNTGKTEDEFIASLKGADGRSINPKGLVANQAALAAIVNPVTNDAYTTEDTGHLYVYNGTGWTDLGSLRGADGRQGPMGMGLNVVGEFATVADRPDPATLKAGDSVYVLDTGALYQVNEAGLYNVGIHIKGEEGEQGPAGNDGAQGPVGPGIQIMGSFATEAALIAAHPTGTAGEAYLVGPDLYLYGVDPVGGTTKWYNAGPFRGLKGDQGIQGVRGLRGLQGEQGIRGALWLTLPNETPPGLNYGTPGDWAVTPSFQTYFRPEVGEWQLMGRLVAGDVNSPVGAGKKVREGTAWVDLPVDEVTNPTVDAQYVRKGIAGGKTQWALINIPASGIPEVPASTTIPQGRTSAGWVAVVPAVASPAAGKRYNLVDNAWALAPVQVDAPSGSKLDKVLGYKLTTAGVGSWEEMTFDSYNLLTDGTPRTASFTVDPTKQNCYSVSGTTAGITVTLPKLATGRSMMCVFTVVGATNKLAFASGTGTPTVAFNNNVAAADIEYGASQTVITAFFNGINTWIVSKGPSY